MLQPKRWGLFLLLILAGCNSYLAPARKGVMVPTPVIPKEDETKRMEFSAGATWGGIESHGHGALYAGQFGVARIWQHPYILYEAGVSGYAGAVDLEHYPLIGEKYSAFGLQVRLRATPFGRISKRWSVGVTTFLEHYVDFGGYPNFNRSFDQILIEQTVEDGKTTKRYLYPYEEPDYGTQIGLAALVQYRRDHWGIGFSFGIEGRATEYWGEDAYRQQFAFGFPVQYDSHIVEFAFKASGEASSTTVTYRKWW